jgi:hypothetical protein
MSAPAEHPFAFLLVRAPRLYWRKKTAEQYATSRNPYPAGTWAFYEWRRRFWSDQADRARRASLIALGVAVASQLVSIASMVWGLLS